MDEIEKLLDEIRKDKKIQSLRPRRGFPRKFLETVGEIFEVYGFGTTEVYLRAQESRNRSEATALLHLLQKFRRCRKILNSPAIGRYIIKTLDTIVREEKRHD